MIDSSVHDPGAAGAAEETPEPGQRKKTIAEGMDRDLSRLGNSLITKFHVLMKVSQIYDAKNVVLHQFIRESLQMINTFIEAQGNLAIKILKDDIFLNEQRLRYSAEGFTSFKYVLTQWKKRLIGEVVFKERLDEAVLKEFIYCFFDLKDGKEENAALFARHLTERGILSIAVEPLETLEGDETASMARKKDQREIAQKVFFETVGTIKEAITKIKTKQYADVRKLKRLAQRAVDLVMEDESILLGMATIKNYDEYTFNHSVNVAIYSLAIGRRLALSKNVLTDLVITALLHDVGKSKVPREILNKPGPLDDAEWVWMKKHPLLGVEIVLNLKELGEINPRMVIGIFDHHAKNDGSGYPKRFRRRGIGLFGRIIQVADAYDAMTTLRPYKKNPYTPEQALAVMLRDSDSHFDPILLKIFIGLVGIYPIGSLVLLRSGELGIVYKPHPDPEWADRPQVMIIDRDGKGDAQKRILDLSEGDGAGGFKQSVVKTLDPRKYHIDIPSHFMKSGA